MITSSISFKKHSYIVRDKSLAHNHSFLRVQGKDMTGKDMTGSDRRGKDMTEGMTGMTGYNLSHFLLGKGMTGKDMTGSDRRGKDMTARPSCP